MLEHLPKAKEYILKAGRDVEHYAEGTDYFEQAWMKYLEVSPLAVPLVLGLSALLVDPSGARFVPQQSAYLSRAVGGCRARCLL